MEQWIMVGVLYLVGFGALALLGGLAAAGDALRGWGERTGCIDNS
jgi:hypothetical protein